MTQKMKYHVGDLVTLGTDQGLDLPNQALGQEGMVIETFANDPGVYDVALGDMQVIVQGVTWYQMEPA